MNRYLLQILSLLGCLILVSCSASKDEKVVDAIDSALYHLSQGTPDCQKAIDALEDVGRQNSNPRYIQTLASAYACRGGFSELQFFHEISSVDSSNFLKSIATLTTSSQGSADSDEFTDLQTAIDLILYSGSRTTPSADETKNVFGNRHGTNLNLQALYMIIVQLGRYVSWYGNTDATGAKGAGGNGNTCFFDYSPVPLALATSYGGANACTAGNTGSDSLDYVLATTAVAKTRLCYGAMLVNNLVDILANTTLSSNTSIGDISTLYTDIQPYITSASLLDPGMPAFIATLSQSDCETSVTASDSVVQLYFASIFEGGLP
ncbi:MAG: hypothetical protein K2P81_12170 [Bacteriovoracaceae bacterium]|nr:hypothetical protein [Bacteriovoracaceae bacterium]